MYGQRASLMALAGSLAAVLAPVRACGAPPAAPTPEPGVVRSERLSRGVPLGGIGCGAVELLTDGGLGNATTSNNWTHPIRDLHGSFAAAWVHAGSQKATRVLCRRNSYGLPSVADTEFRGLCSTAAVEYVDPALPLRVSLRAFSPLIPGDLRNSALPVAVFVFKLSNEARGPVTAAVALSWESLLGVGASSSGPFSDRTRSAARAQPLVDGFGGALFDSAGAPAASASARQRLNAYGNAALLVHAPSADTHVTVAGWNALDAAPSWWQAFADGGEVAGSVGEGIEGKVHPAAVVCARVPLAARQSVEVAFVVSWYTRRFYTASGEELGHFYEKTFDSAEAVGLYVLENRQSLAALTNEWQNALLRSTLPPAIAHRAIGDASVLVSRTVLTRDSGGSEVKPGPSRFAMIGAGGTYGDLPTSRFYGSMLATWFPDLDARELRTFAALQAPTGDMRTSYGSVTEGFASVVSADTQPAAVDAGAAASWACRLLRSFRQTGDQRLLDELYPSAKQAIDALIRRQSPAGTAACAGREALLRLAAIRVGQALADAMPDRSFARSCADAGAAARDEIVRVLWDGRALRCAPATSASSGAEPIRTDQLAGQWLADALDVGDLLPTDVLRRCVDSVAAVSGASGEPDLRTRIATETGTVWCDVAETLTSRAALLALRGRTDAATRLGQAVCSDVAERLRLRWHAPVRFAIAPGADAEHVGAADACAALDLVAALSGVDLDVVQGRLRLAPRVPQGAAALDLPVFTGRFWGRVTRRTSLGRVTVSLRVERLIRPPAEPKAPRRATDLEIREIVLPDDIAAGAVPTVSVGRAPVPGKEMRDARGRRTYALDPPLRLAVGQRLDVTFR